MLKKILLLFVIIQIFTGLTLTVDGWACGILGKSCQVGTCCRGLICNQRKKCQIDCKEKNKQCTEANQCCDELQCEKGTCQLVETTTCSNLNEECYDEGFKRSSGGRYCCEGLGCQSYQCKKPYNK